MAILTEQEWDIEATNQVGASFFATLRGGMVDEVYCTLQIDGFNVTWMSTHQNGMIRVYEIGKLTNDWLRLLNLIGTENGKLVEESLKGFLANNLTYSN